MSLLIVLIIAGELIFSLPFQIPRFFRPTLLDVFQLNNAELGDIFAVYGIVAMLSYFPGGILADRFAPRKLMTFSLLATAIGGVYLATIPNSRALYYVFGYWGCTSVLLFWSAMIKETRVLASSHTQGIAFGLLDGGRGLVASLVASLAVVILASYFVSGNETEQEKRAAFQAIALFYSLMTGIAAVLIWRFIPNEHSTQTGRVNQNSLIASISHVLRDRTVWFQGGIIVCAYCGYRALDNYGIYATQVLQMSQLESSNLTTLASYSRPIAAVGAGILADRWHTGKSVKMFFAMTAVGFASMALMEYQRGMLWLIIANIVLTFLTVYALRGIYFALIEQAQIRQIATGTAVGMISLIGYTPDIFFASLTGRILDANPGFVGFQHYFLLLFAIAILGVILVHGLNRLTQNSANETA